MHQITDKNRKILWGRSGNRCAICKIELVVDASISDDEAIVGEECHIISSQLNGPRNDTNYPHEKFDSYENLILLCRVHHKMVDDQAITYNAEILRQIKSNHEEFVTSKLSEKENNKQVGVRRKKANVPVFLTRINTGKQLIDLFAGTYAFYMDHDELNSQLEVDIVGGFLEEVGDLEMIDDLEPNVRVQWAYDLSQKITILDNSGFFVFGAREIQYLEGGISDLPSNWPVAHIRVIRKDNDSIIKLN